MQFDYRALGRVIRRLRMERGLSQEVFSGLADIARSHLSAIETGTKEANLNTLYKIAQITDLTLSELIRMSEDETEKTKPPAEPVV